MKFVLIFCVLLFLPSELYSQSILQKIESEQQQIFQTASKSVLFNDHVYRRITDSLLGNQNSLVEKISSRPSGN